MKREIKAVRVSIQDVKSSNASGYNPTEWNRKVDSYCQYKDVTFYKRTEPNEYKIDEFIVVYTIEEGITFVKAVEYGSCLSSASFSEIRIIPCDTNFKSIIDARNDNTLNNWDGSFDNVIINQDKFYFNDGTSGYIQNSPAGRKFLAESHFKVSNSIL